MKPVVRVWKLNDAAEDSGAESERVSLTRLSMLGVQYVYLSRSPASAVTSAALLADLKKYHGLIVEKEVHWSDSCNDDEIALKEHTAEDIEAWYVNEGEVFIDVRDESDCWIRISARRDDLFMIRPGLYRRFALHNKASAKISSLLRSERVAMSRDTVEHSSFDVRAAYEQWLKLGAQPNGTGVVLQDGAQALANYPHARRANGMIYVSGTSSRRPDNTHVGAKRRDDGTWDLQIETQTRAVLENIRRILQHSGADLQHLVALTVYLVDFRDYAGFNRVYNEYFDAETGPTRTTVAVARLPHPNLLIEIQSVAVEPSQSP